MEFITSVVNWSNRNNGFLMAVLTAVYVLATILILRQSRKTNRLQQEALTQARSLERSRTRVFRKK